MAELPLLRRFPALGTLPRATLGTFPTPVQRLTLDDGRTLLLKRDDLTGVAIGGNKLRALEWLLGDLRPGERVLTVGPRGSTHALTTAICAASLGAATTVVRWNQEMNAAARRVAARLEVAARVIDAAWVPAAFSIVAMLRLRGGVRWIPAGGTTNRGVLGQVNAAMELADQVRDGECEVPERLVVPLGTGGTAAGLALGLRIAGLGTQVIAVRVVPRVLGRAGRIVKRANDTAMLIEELTGQRVPRLTSRDVVVESAYYGGAYGRPLERRPETEHVLRSVDVGLDDTYSRKAFAAAVAQARHRTLFWLTFDGRLLGDL